MHNTSDKMKGVLFDYARSSRIGLPEAIFSQGKPRSTLVELLERFSAGNPPILFTRLEPEIFNGLSPCLKTAYDYDPLSCTAFSARLPDKTAGSVGIVSGGSADAKVAREAFRTLEYLGIRRQIYEDCGVAGLWRLVDNLDSINTHDALIVVAGMEGALPSVLAGLSPKPVFAVPTSVGYGIAQGGNTALAGMLASCAPGIGVLNIDNGYGAACAAARVVNLL